VARIVTGSSRPARKSLLDRAARVVHWPATVKYSLPFLALVIAGCGARTGLTELAIAACSEDPPTCIAPSVACDAPRAVAAVCNAQTKQFECPANTRVYERVADSNVCLPFHDPDGPIEAMDGSLVRVPTDDGRCLWIAEDARVAGVDLRNVALIADVDAPFGSCPKRARFPDNIAQSIVDTEDPSQHIQITGGYRFAGRTHVLYREFRNDPSAPFGLRHVGSGIASFERGRVILPSTPRFATDLDLGDAHLVEGDRAYVWGCPGPPEFLTERCIVARFDASNSMELFAGSSWVASTRGRDGKSVFDAGPWISSVVRRGDTLRHVYAVGFGSDLQVHTASTPEGPWSSGATIARCDLPGSDDKAFCAGPVAHEELADPTRPGELVVTYGVGTTRGGERAPLDYWPRLQRIP
jgi:hypothetical protein